VIATKIFVDGFTSLPPACCFFAPDKKVTCLQSLEL
jgi:hypothetical protein